MKQAHTTKCHLRLDKDFVNQLCKLIEIRKNILFNISYLNS